MNYLFILYYTLAWAAGMSLTFLWLKNQKETLLLTNVKTTLMLTGAAGVVLVAFAILARFDNYFLLFVYAGLAAFLTYKFVDKKKLEADPSNNMRLAASNGIASKKEDNYLFVGLVVATVLVAMCVFVFNTHLKLFMQRAGTLPNVLGILLFLASIGSLLWLKRDGGVTTSKTNPGIVWLILLGLAIATSCGFNFDYFGLNA